MIDWKTNSNSNLVAYTPLGSMLCVWREKDQFGIVTETWSWSATKSNGTSFGGMGGFVSPEDASVNLTDTIEGMKGW